MTSKFCTVEPEVHKKHGRYWVDSKLPIGQYLFTIDNVL